MRFFWFFIFFSFFTLLLSASGICAADQSAEPDDLQKYLVSKILIDYAFSAERTEISLVRSSLKRVDLSDCIIETTPMTQSSPRGRFPMRVEIYHNNALVEKGTVTLDVRHFSELLVPVDRIKRHEILTEDLFELRRFEVTSLTEEMLTDAKEIIGYRAMQNLQAGRYVSRRRTELIPDIEKREPVTIVGGSGLFEIRVRGEALQDGRIGQTIKVKNIDSKKILSGVITAPGVVELLF